MRCRAVRRAVKETAQARVRTHISPPPHPVLDDVVDVDGEINIFEGDTIKAIDAWDRQIIDQYGLDEIDRKLLRVIIDNFAGGPVGLNTLAATLQEEAGTIEEIFEPYLMQLGLLNRTAQGRIATAKTYKYLGFDIPKDNKLL